MSVSISDWLGKAKDVASKARSAIKGSYNPASGLGSIGKSSAKFVGSEHGPLRITGSVGVGPTVVDVRGIAKRMKEHSDRYSAIKAGVKNLSPERQEAMKKEMNVGGRDLMKKYGVHKVISGKAQEEHLAGLEEKLKEHQGSGSGILHHVAEHPYIAAGAAAGLAALALRKRKKAQIE